MVVGKVLSICYNHIGIYLGLEGPVLFWTTYRNNTLNNKNSTLNNIKNKI